MARKRTPTKRKQSDNEGNKFDKIMKENLLGFIPALINKVLKVRIDRTGNLPQTKLQTTKEVEPDFAQIIYNDKYPEGALFQIEFEAKDEKGTDARNLQYVAIEYRKHALPVLLHLLYLPRGRPKNIKGRVEFDGLSFTYSVHCMEDISFKEFIYSDVPEEVILAVLANPDGKKPQEIIRMVLERLHHLKGKRREFYKFINQLKILSMLRNLRQETEKQIEDMIINEDIVRQIKEDKMFQLGTKQGMEKGIEKGIEKGMERGMKKGKMKKTVEGILNMNAKKFEVIVIAEILQEPLDFVKSILNQFKKEKEIIALLKKRDAKVESIAKKLKVTPVLVEVIQEDMKKKK